MIYSDLILKSLFQYFVFATLMVSISFFRHSIARDPNTFMLYLETIFIFKPLLNISYSLITNSLVALQSITCSQIYSSNHALSTVLAQFWWQLTKNFRDSIVVIILLPVTIQSTPGENIERNTCFVANWDWLSYIFHSKVVLRIKDVQEKGSFNQIKVLKGSTKTYNK